MINEGKKDYVKMLSSKKLYKAQHPAKEQTSLLLYMCNKQMSCNSNNAVANFSQLYG